MSLEDQYDAWVRSVTGTGRHSATKQDRAGSISHRPARCWGIHS